MLDIGTLSQETSSILPTPILDLYPGAYGAYSLRKLSSTYSGPCIRVVRAIDGQQSDIGFNTLGGLDKIALKNFANAVPGNNQLVIFKIYDQSGNNRTMEWTAIPAGTFAPIIYSNNLVSTKNGTPYFAGYDLYTGAKFVNFSSTLSNINSSVYVSAYTGQFNSITGQNGVIGGWGLNSGNEFNTYNLFADNRFYYGNGSTGTSITSSLPASVSSPYKFIVGAIGRSTTNRELFSNGVSDGVNSTNIGATTFSPTIFSWYRPLFSTAGSVFSSSQGIFEVILYATGHNSATAIGIQDNMNEYANVY